MSFNDKHITVEEMNANPSILNNKRIEQVHLEGLHLKNAIISNLVMKDVNAMNGIFENITFENCTFIKVRFDDGNFNNVSFKKCKFIPIDESKKYDTMTTFNDASFNKVIFDSSDFKYVDFGVINGNNGFILFKNITNAIPRGRTFFSVENAQVRVADSSIDGLIAGDENVHAITKNSQFTKYAGIYCDNNFIINTKMQESDVSAFKVLVIRDSVVDAAVGINGGKAYLTNNTYLHGTITLLNGETETLGVGLHAKPDDSIYIVAKDREPCAFSIFGGTVTLKGFTLDEHTRIGSLLKEKPPITAINLKDVTIQGGNWKGLRLLGGQWENVRIEPPVLVDRTSIKNLRYYRLDFPKGPPWNKKGEFVIETIENQTPFVWEEPKIPTPEDLGMVWWPEVEPGYHGQ